MQFSTKVDAFFRTFQSFCILLTLWMCRFSTSLRPVDGTFDPDCKLNAEMGQPGMDQAYKFLRSAVQKSNLAHCNMLAIRRNQGPALKTPFAWIFIPHSPSFIHRSNRRMLNVSIPPTPPINPVTRHIMPSSTPLHLSSPTSLCLQFSIITKAQGGGRALARSH